LQEVLAHLQRLQHRLQDVQRSFAMRFDFLGLLVKRLRLIHPHSCALCFLYSRVYGTGERNWCLVVRVWVCAILSVYMKLVGCPRIAFMFYIKRTQTTTHAHKQSLSPVPARHPPTYTGTPSHTQPEFRVRWEVGA
jgi:hypothetical protein